MDIWTVIRALLVPLRFYESNRRNWEKGYNNSVKRIFRRVSGPIEYCLKIEKYGEELLVSLSSVGSVSVIHVGHGVITGENLASWLEELTAKFEANRFEALIVEEGRREAQRSADVLLIEAEDFSPIVTTNNQKNGSTTHKLSDDVMPVVCTDGATMQMIRVAPIEKPISNLHPSWLNENEVAGSINYVIEPEQEVVNG
jgi:hypothetical protein